jgi:glycosyltransferase involved in cell wall biosynthesis
VSLKYKPTVTIGIPAYNEERAILSCIKFIKSQSRKNYVLDRIAVYSDGSKDKTVQLVKENYKDVVVRDFKNNEGQGRRINQILKDSTSDVVFTIDSDIKLMDKDVFDNLIKKFDDKRNIGLVCSYHKAIEPKSLIGQASYFGYRVWDNARSSVGRKGIRYYCEGGLLAYSKSFASAFSIPVKQHVPGDAYAFYSAIDSKFDVEVAKNAKVYMDLPEKYSDYIQQMKRHINDLGLAYKGFDESLPEKYEVLTTRIKIISLLRELTKTPVIGVFYAFLQTWVRIQTVFYSPPRTWVPIERK